jgi:hypothetical protein
MSRCKAQLQHRVVCHVLHTTERPCTPTLPSPFAARISLAPISKRSRPETTAPLQAGRPHGHITCRSRSPMSYTNGSVTAGQKTYPFRARLAIFISIVGRSIYGAAISQPTFRVSPNQVTQHQKSRRNIRLNQTLRCRAARAIWRLHRALLCLSGVSHVPPVPKPKRTSDLFRELSVRQCCATTHRTGTISTQSPSKQSFLL